MFKEEYGEDFQVDAGCTGQVKVGRTREHPQAGADKVPLTGVQQWCLSVRHRNTAQTEITELESGCSALWYHLTRGQSLCFLDQLTKVKNQA